MCLKKLLELFQKPGSPPVVPQPVPIPLAIPHPEEPMNPDATIQSVSVDMVRQSWYLQWQVPESSYPFFDAIKIKMDPTIAFPAWTCGNEITCQPAFCNPGVLAHEMAHVIWFTMTDNQKADFQTAYNAILATDPMMTLLDSQNSYMNTAIVEAHAEVYRYLGERMTDSLKKYYPKLF
jgi:hypothetical protein